MVKVKAQTIVFDKEPTANMLPIRIYCDHQLVIGITKSGSIKSNSDLDIGKRTTARTLTGIKRYLEKNQIDTKGCKVYEI